MEGLACYVRFWPPDGKVTPEDMAHLKAVVEPLSAKLPWDHGRFAIETAFSDGDATIVETPVDPPHVDDFDKLWVERDTFQCVALALRMSFERPSWTFRVFDGLGLIRGEPLRPFFLVLRGGRAYRRDEWDDRREEPEEALLDELRDILGSETVNLVLGRFAG